jgi:hypothetical protein
VLKALSPVTVQRQSLQQSTHRVCSPDQPRSAALKPYFSLVCWLRMSLEPSSSPVTQS